MSRRTRPGPLLAVGALLAVVMAGCTGPDIPDHAVQDTYDGMPGARLSAWLEPGDGAVRINAVFENHGHPTAVNASHRTGPWNLTITDADGQRLIIDSREGCAPFEYKLISPHQVEEYRYTWGHRAHNELGPCQAGQQPIGDKVPPGNYTAVLRFLLAYEPHDAFEITLPIVVSD